MAAAIFDESIVTNLIVRWQQASDDKQKGRLFTEIWSATKGLRDMLIAKYTVRYGLEVEDLHQILAVKLTKILPRFKREAGRSYTFLFLSWNRCIWTALGKGKRRESFITLIGGGPPVTGEDDLAECGSARVVYDNCAAPTDHTIDELSF